MKKLDSESLRNLPRVTKLVSSREQKTWDPHPGLSTTTHFPKPGTHIPVGHKVSSAGKETFKIFIIMWLLEWILGKHKTSLDIVGFSRSHRLGQD